MKVIINIEMTENDKTVADISQTTGLTKDQMISTYNRGLTMIMAKMGDVETTTDNINVDTRIYESNVFDVVNSCMLDSDLSKVIHSIDTIKDMLDLAGSGLLRDGMIYPKLNIKKNKTACLEAISILKDFINTCVPDTIEDCDGTKD